MKRPKNRKYQREFQVQMYSGYWRPAWWPDSLIDLPCVSWLSEAVELLDTVDRAWKKQGINHYYRIASRTVSSWRVSDDWLQSP